HFPTGVSQRFPGRKFLDERGVDSYMAVPFHDNGGRVLGFLSVFDDRPMPAESRRLFIMRIFAARAAAEFERLRAEQQLQDREARFPDLYENAPTAYLVGGPGRPPASANRRAASHSPSTRGRFSLDASNSTACSGSSTSSSWRRAPRSSAIVARRVVTSRRLRRPPTR